MDTQVSIGKESEGKDREGKDIKRKESGKIDAVYFPNDELLNEAFKDYILMRKQIKKPMTE